MSFGFIVVAFAVDLFSGAPFLAQKLRGRSGINDTLQVSCVDQFVIEFSKRELIADE